MRIWRKLLGLSRSIKLDTESWSDVRAFLELVWCKEGMYMQPCGSSSRGTRGGFMGFMGFPCIDCTLAFLGAWISARTYFGGVVDGISWIWLVMEVLRFLEWKFICGWRVAESRWYSFPHSSFRPRHPCSFLRDGIGGLVLPITLRLVKNIMMKWRLSRSRLDCPLEKVSADNPDWMCGSETHWPIWQWHRRS